MASRTVDIVIIGSGMGGATFAAGLAPTGRKILDPRTRRARLRTARDARDARAIFQRGVFRPQETWLDGGGPAFNPGNYYYVGGNSKLYGAVLIRYRAQDFRADRASRRRDAGLAVRLRGTGALVLRGPRSSTACAARSASIRPSPRIPRRIPYPPVPDEPAIASGPRAHEARRSASVSAAARRRHRAAG